MTAFWIYDLAAKIYNSKIALFSGLGFLLLPGVAVGSMVAATDALLLFSGPWHYGVWSWPRKNKKYMVGT